MASNILTTNEKIIRHIHYVDHPFDTMDQSDDDKPFHIDSWLIPFHHEHLQYRMDEEPSPNTPLDHPFVQSSHSHLKTQEQALSQRLTQLSTSTTYDDDDHDDHDDDHDDHERKRSHSATTMPNQPLRKKNRIDLVNDDQPDCCFYHYICDQRLIHTYFSHISIDRDLLCQLMWYCYQLDAFELHTSLWSIYLRYGTSQWTEQDRMDIEMEGFEDFLPSNTITQNHTDHFWLSDIKKSLLNDYHTRSMHRSDQNEQLICQTMIEERLNDIHKKKDIIRQYYEETKKKMSLYWTSEIERLMLHFIEHYGWIPLRRKIQFKRSILIYSYRDHLIQHRIEQLQPNSYQMDMAQRLYDINFKFQLNKHLLIEHQERLRYHQPPSMYDCLQTDLPMLIRTITDENHQCSLLAEYERCIENTKTNIIVIHLAIIQAKINQYQTSIHIETEQMWHNHHDEHRSDKKMTSDLIRLIDQRILNNTKKLEMMYNYLVYFDVQHSYGHIENIQIGKEMKDRRIGFISNLIIDPMIKNIHRIFSPEQLQLLRRGPSYVAPDQLQLMAMETSMDDQIKKQYTPLHRRLTLLTSKFNVPLTIRENLKYDSKKEFQTLFSYTISSDRQERARYEKETIETIRSILEQYQFVLRRTANDQNTFYLSYQSNFDTLKREYMIQQDTYRVLFTIDEVNQTTIERKWKDRCRQYTMELEKLFKEKKLTQEIYHRLQINIDTIQLPHLLFLPDFDRQSGQLKIQPHLPVYHSLTSKLALFLQQLLRPLIKHALRRTELIDETDLIQRLEKYAHIEQRLKPSTSFVVITIDNIHTMMSHRTCIETLKYFLQYHLTNNRLEYTSMYTGRLQTITIDTVIRLMELFLENNLFYFDKKIYEIIRGIPNIYILNDLLETIYLSIWQRYFLDDPHLKEELFFKYENQIFFTWSYSKHEFQSLITSILKQSPQIQYHLSFDRRVRLGSTWIENRQGQLSTKIHMIPTNDRFSLTLPYVPYHPSWNHQHWLQSRLLQIIRSCSNTDDYMYARIRLETIYLIQGYSLISLQKQWNAFYRYFNLHNQLDHFDQSTYQQMRHQLMTWTDSQRQAIVKINDFATKDRLLYLYYLSNGGPYRRFEKKFYEIWSKYLKDDVHLSSSKTMIILKVKPIYSLNALFTHSITF